MKKTKNRKDKKTKKRYVYDTAIRGILERVEAIYCDT